MSSAETALPHPELVSYVNPNDVGPAIVVSAALCMTIGLLFFCTRLWIRIPFRALFGLDDAVVLIATMFATVQSILIMVAVKYGLGKRASELSAQDSLVVQKSLYAASVLYVTALSLGKLAMAFLFIRLTRGARAKIANVLMGAVAVWGVGSILVIGLRQDLVRPWGIFPNVAHSTFIRWCVVEALGAVLEILILIFAFAMVWDLQMSRSAKFGVLIGFFVRLPTLGIITARLYELNNVLLLTTSEVDPTFSPSLPEIFTQLEMHFNLYCATIPCLKIFLKNFQTGYLGSAGLHRPDDYYQRSGTNMATRGSEKNGSGLRMKFAWMLESKSGESRSRESHITSTVEGGADDGLDDGSATHIVVTQSLRVNYENGRV